MDTITVLIGGIKYSFNVAQDKEKTLELTKRVDELVQAAKADNPTATNLQCTTLAFVNFMSGHIALEQELERLRGTPAPTKPDGELTTKPTTEQPAKSLPAEEVASETKEASKVEPDRPPLADRRGSRTDHTIRRATISPKGTAAKPNPITSTKRTEPRRPAAPPASQTRDLMMDNATPRKSERKQGMSIDPLTGKPKKPGHLSAAGRAVEPGKSINPFADFRKTESYSIDPVTGEPKNKTKEASASIDPLTGERKVKSKKPSRPRVTEPAKTDESANKTERNGNSINPFF
ncbi:MAG: cell division protein ZapA [Fastidiosipilaceae bacterium]|jgi:cell division protein ZapA (FtsZ GTPase activity inhibitor)